MLWPVKRRSRAYGRRTVVNQGLSGVAVEAGEKIPTRMLTSMGGQVSKRYRSTEWASQGQLGWRSPADSTGSYSLSSHSLPSCLAGFGQKGWLFFVLEALFLLRCFCLITEGGWKASDEKWALSKAYLSGSLVLNPETEGQFLSSSLDQRNNLYNGTLEIPVPAWSRCALLL